MNAIKAAMEQINKCSYTLVKPVAIIFISKYMIKRYGLIKVLNRMRKYKYKYRT